MSLLVAHLTPTQVLLISDTLASSPDGRASMFASKVDVLPQYDLAVAATGASAVAKHWRRTLDHSIICRNIDDLALVAPIALRRVWEINVDKFGSDLCPTIIRHYGWSPAKNRYVGHSFGSVDDFELRELPDGLLYAPRAFAAVDAWRPTSPPDLTSFVELAITMAEEVATWDRSELESRGLEGFDRLGIGGELVLTLLENEQSIQAKVHRFDDFDESWGEMWERYGATLSSQ